MKKEKLEYRQDASYLVREQRLKYLRIMTLRELRLFQDFARNKSHLRWNTQYVKHVIYYRTVSA